MKIITAHTTAGFVVRRIWPSGEDAWRWEGHNKFSHSPDHKDTWVSVNRALVPAEVLREVARLRTAEEIREG